MTRIIKIILALAFVLSMSAIVPQRTSAYGWQYGGTTPVPWKVSPIYWCFGQWSWNQSSMNTARAAVNHWASYMNRRSLVETFAGDPNCDITLGQSALGVNADAATTNTGAANGAMLYANIYINTSRTSQFWIYGASQNCTVPCPKPIDLWTVVVHEMGHALGIGHNWTGGPLCGAGYNVTRADLACSNDYYSLDPMYPFAADGYKRWIASDSIAALVVIGYRW